MTLPPEPTTVPSRLAHLPTVKWDEWPPDGALAGIKPSYQPVKQWFLRQTGTGGVPRRPSAGTADAASLGEGGTAYLWGSARPLRPQPASSSPSLGSGTPRECPPQATVVSSYELYSPWPLRGLGRGVELPRIPPEAAPAKRRPGETLRGGPQSQGEGHLLNPQGHFGNTTGNYWRPCLFSDKFIGPQYYISVNKINSHTQLQVKNMKII